MLSCRVGKVGKCAWVEVRLGSVCVQDMYIGGQGRFKEDYIIG